VALLKVNADNLPTVKIGDSDKLQVGQWVLAIGSPFGFDHSATHGIVSAVGRSLPSETYVPFIQTDVALNPGNSGGPLINMDGEVVGINSQIYSSTGGYMGLSFTIPIDMAMNEVEQIKETGHVTRGWLGVSIQDVTQDLARSFGLGRPHGALVASVLPEGPAHAAGIKPGDVIVSFAGHTVENSSQLPTMVARTKPGETVPVTVIRQGNEQTFQVKIGELPARAGEIAAAAGERSATGRLGITAANLTQSQLRSLKIPYGVRVEEVSEGPAQEAGIQAGDVIMQIGHTSIQSVEQLREVVAQLPAGQPVPVLVQRGEGALFIPVMIPASP
jgi:serine protease Do